MSKHPWMPLYVAEYQADTVDLDVDQHGVYLLLLMVAWRRPDGCIPDDMVWLKRVLPPMHGHMFNRLVKPILARFFTLENGNWTNKRLTNERQKADKISVKQKQNADKRWSRANENNDIADAVAMPRARVLTTTLTITKKEKDIRRVRSDSSLEEVRFWEAYPRRDGTNPKKPAIEKFRRAIDKGIDPEEIIAGTNAYRKHLLAKGTENTAFVKQAVVFLNQEIWRDFLSDSDPSSNVESVPPPNAPPGAPSHAELLAIYSKPKGLADDVAKSLPRAGNGIHREVEDDEPKGQGAMPSHQAERPGMGRLDDLLRGVVNGVAMGGDGVSRRANSVDYGPMPVATMVRR